MLINNISFGSKKSPYIQRDTYMLGDDYIHRTQYFAKNGDLVGFKLQHSNGIVEYARQVRNPNSSNIVLLTKGYKNYNPIKAKVIVDYTDFYENIDLNRAKGHNPSLWAAVKILEENGLWKKRKK